MQHQAVPKPRHLLWNNLSVFLQSIVCSVTLKTNPFSDGKLAILPHSQTQKRGYFKYSTEKGQGEESMQ